MNTSHMYDALHAAAGPELRAWMDAHHAAVERADRYREAIDNAADSIYVNVADTLKTDPTYFSSPEEAVRAHNGIAEELWGERLDRADRDLYPFSQAWPFIYALALEAVPYAFENMRRGMRAAAPVREYRYGVQNRPVHHGNVPQGHVRVDRALAHDPRTRWGIVVYNRPLTEDEVRQYQLVPHMPLAEVVESVVARLSKYGEKYAADARKDGGVFKTAAASAFHDLNVYTDVPMEEMRARVAAELLRRFPAPEPAPAAVREYRYGARNRPPGYATVPSGYIRVDPPPFPQEARVRHGVVVYNRPLTDEEVRSYELHPYMPLAEVVDGVIASFGEYAEEAYAPNVREEGAEQVRSETGYYLDDHTVYTDVPLGEVYKHVAAELLRRFPAPASTGDLTTTPAFRRWFGASKVVDAAGKPLRVYHGTTAGGFTEFQHGERAIGVNRLGFWFDAGTFLPSEAFAGGEEIPRWGGAGNILPVYLSLKNPKEYASDPLTRDEYDTLDALTRAKASGTPGEQVPEGEVERTIRREAATLRVRPALPQDVRGRIENIVRYLRHRGWRDAIEKMLLDLLPETGGRMQVVDNAVADAARERLAKHYDGIVLRSTLTDRSLLKTLRWDHPDAERIPLGRGGNVEHYGSDWYLALHPTQIKSATGNVGTFDPADPDIRRNPRRR